MDSPAREYWRTWFWRTATTKVMTVCIAVWIAIGAVWLLLPPTMRLSWLSFLAVPSDVHLLLHRPWTVLTFMFVHIEFLHLAVNMLWWLMFGGICEQSQGAGRTMALYICGGLSGAAAFMAFPSGGAMLIGASCSVMTVMGATVALMPRYKVNILLFGPVDILWVALVATLFFVVLAPGTGESVAHGAALAVGVSAGLLRRRGVDITAPLRSVFGFFGRLCSRPAVARATVDIISGSDEEQLDALLEKVSRSGYGSLTAAERQRLFDLSQRFNHRR